MSDLDLLDGLFDSPPVPSPTREQTAQAAAAAGADEADRRFDEIVGPPAPAPVVEPRLGLPAIEDAEQDPEDRRFWSVTTVIGILEKRGLVYWSAENAAVAAVRQQASWRGLLEDHETAEPSCEHRDDDCPVVKWIADARFRRPPGYRSATELGTAVHAAVEQYALTGVRPEVDDEVLPFLDQFDRWAQIFSPSYQATEVAVYHPDLGYAGTADAFLSIGGHGSPTLPGTDLVRYIGDYKSSRKSVDSKGKATKPYAEEVGLQLAAYRHAKYAAVWRPRRREVFRRRYYLLSPAEQAMAQPVPEVDTGLVIHITPEHCEAYPIRCDEEVFESYLAVQDAARWVLALSKRAMSDPLVPPGGDR